VNEYELLDGRLASDARRVTSRRVSCVWGSRAWPRVIALSGAEKSGGLSNLSRMGARSDTSEQPARRPELSAARAAAGQAGSSGQRRDRGGNALARYRRSPRPRARRVARRGAGCRSRVDQENVRALPKEAAHVSRLLVGIQPPRPRSSPSIARIQLGEPTAGARTRAASDLIRPVANRRLLGW
jgi:hypothetical protein